jgi:hypothetical protein
MKIELEGATVCVVGRLKGWSKQTIKNAVRDAGGAFVGTPRDGGVVLLGNNPSGTGLTKARSRACTIVEGDDALALLSDGFVELEEAPRRTLDELVGEARALLARGAGDATFASLVALLDGCEAGHVADLANYIAPQVQSWGLSYGLGASSRNMDARGVTGICGDAGGSIRTMPVDWVAELLRGGPSPKHSICDTLSFSRVEVSSTTAARVFDHDTIAHLRAFSLGETNDGNRKTKTFFKKMIKSSALHRVRTFVVHDCAPDGLALLRDHPECLPALDALLLSRSTRNMRYRGDTTHACAALAATWGEQLRTFGVSLVEHVAWLKDHRGALPELEHVVLSTSPWDEYEHDYRQTARHLPGALEGVREVSFGAKVFPALEAWLLALGRDTPDTLRVLDLSPTCNFDMIGEEPSTLIARVIADFGLPDVLERVVLNSAFDDALRARLEAAGLEVEVVALDGHGRGA